MVMFLTLETIALSVNRKRMDKAEIPINTLAEDAHLSRSVTIRGIRALERAGELDVTREPGLPGYKDETNAYRLACLEGVAPTPEYTRISNKRIQEENKTERNNRDGQVGVAPTPYPNGRPGGLSSNGKMRRLGRQVIYRPDGHELAMIDGAPVHWTNCPKCKAEPKPEPTPRPSPLSAPALCGLCHERPARRGSDYCRECYDKAEVEAAMPPALPRPAIEAIRRPRVVAPEEREWIGEMVTGLSDL